MSESVLHKISEHVYWLPPARPDRPSLCAVVGEEMVVMLDAGASKAHARLFLDQLTLLGISRPRYVVLTHWHWDHVFGAVEVGAEVVSQTRTAEKLGELSKRDWSDAGLARQVETGLETTEGVENIAAEMPSPRRVSVAQASVVYDESLELRLGSVTCRIKHVGGDHAADSSVIFVQPDGALFLGDCLSSVFHAPEPFYTVLGLSRLLDELEEFDADHYVEGHAFEVLTRVEFKAEVAKMREAIKVVEETGPDEEGAFALVEAKTGRRADKDTAYYLRALIAGCAPRGGRELE